MVLCISTTDNLVVQMERKKKQIAGGKIKSCLVGPLLSDILVMLCLTKLVVTGLIALEYTEHIQLVLFEIMVFIMRMQV